MRGHIGIPLVLISALFFSCNLIRSEDKKTEELDTSDASVMLKYDASWHSYDMELKNGFPQLVELSSFEGKDLPRLDFSREAAYTGQHRYWVENSLVLKRASYIGSAPMETSLPANEQNYGPPEAEWQTACKISAGPFVFQDRVLIATLEPAFYVLDSLTLSELYTVELDAVPAGPIQAEQDRTSIRVQHADGTYGRYLLTEAPSMDKTARSSSLNQASDPVEARIQPDPAALKSIEQSFSQLRSLAKDESFIRVDLYDPRMSVASEGAVLFRYYTGSQSEPLRIYIDDILERPYALAVYDEKGQKIQSNIEYEAARVLELHPDEHSDYFIAAAFMGVSSDTTESAALRIVARDR